jgi:glycosyltransferase involved in cell wall biosynthesis
MRITFILPGYAPVPRGGFRIVYGYANYLAKGGHIVSIVHPHRMDPAATLVQKLKNRVWLGVRHLTERPLVPWARLHPNVRAILTHDLRPGVIPDGDAVFAPFWQTAEHVLGYPASKGAKLYLIQHYETWAGPKDRVDATWLMPIHKVVIARWLYDLGVTLGAGRLHHIPNAVDDHFRVLNPPANRPASITTMSHAHDWKGVPDAVAVLKQIHQRYPALPISMFGTDPKGPDVPNWITYHRNPSQQTLVEQIYNGHSIYVGASWMEGWGLPPAEAMACGCVFVGTDSGGCRDYAINNETALLSPPRDQKSLLDNLCRVIENRELRRTLQERGTAFVRTFTWERSGAALEQYIHDVVQQGGAPVSFA